MDWHLLVFLLQVLAQSSLFQAGTVILSLQQLGIPERNITHSILARCPQLLLLDPVTELQPVIQRMFELGVTAEGVRGLVSR